MYYTKHLDTGNVTTRNRKTAEQPKAKHEPTLTYLYTLMVSIHRWNKTWSLESAKLKSLDEAYKTIADQENSIKILQSHIQDTEKRQEKKCKKTYGTPIVRSFRTDTLKMQFLNVHCLPERVSAVESRNNCRDDLAPLIVVKFSQMKDKNSILRLAPSAKKFNAAITRHWPLAFQQQRKALLDKAKRLHKAEKKIRWTRVDSKYCLFADDEQVFADCSR